jgi:hypothetical protein
MKREKKSNECETIATLRWTAPRSERQYLRDQRSLALAGMRRALVRAGHHVPRMFDPRPWVRHHPLTGVVLVCGATALAVTATGNDPARRPGPIRRIIGAGAKVVGRGIGAVASVLARSWAASLAMGVLHRALGDDLGPADSSDSDPCEHELT